MSRKKQKDKQDMVQATLSDVVDERKTKNKSAKKSSKKPSKKETKPKGAKRPSKKPAEKKQTQKKKSGSKKKGKKEPSPKEKAPPVLPESAFSLTQLPGVGTKLEERLIGAKYETVEKISRARPASISKRVEGLSLPGAKKLVDTAKEMVRRHEKAAAPVDEPATQISGEEESISPPKLSLTDVPGLGSKIALSLERAGYDSVARLARAAPENVAKKVGGLSVAKATSFVRAAKGMIREQELAELVGEPPTVVPAKVSVEEKTPQVTEEPVTEEEPEEKPRKRKDHKRAAPIKKAPPPKKPLKTPKAPPKKKPKPLRKDSGLPVPKAIKSLANEMKENWASAEQKIRDRKESDEDAERLLETVEVVNMTADETTERIVDTALDILNETMMSGRPAFDIPSRSGDNIVWDEVRDLLLLGMRTISRPYHSLASVVDATRTARVMEIVFNLLKLHLHATKREVYYSDVNLFREQKYSDKIIEDVASMIQTTRDSIHVVASARGSAMGRVTIRDGGDLIDLTKMGTGGWAVTPFLDQLEIVESDAEFIILSEKDAAVMRLAEAKYWNRQPCIVITGKGSGDIATRAFLKMLVKELEIPAFALVDSDPYGHYIYSVFLRGSKRLSYESPFIATPELKLLGVLSRDLDEYKIPKAVRIPMQPTDIKRVKDMLKEPFVKRNKPWVEDLELMLKLKEKAEIQAFASHSFEFLTDEYLPRKLETGDWI
jgi:meiotic recombination protein SPO11